MSGLMTNDRAVEMLNAIIFLLDENVYTDEVEEAIHIAISALTAQPEEDATSDCISRRAAVEAVEFGITYAKAIDVNTGESKELFKEGNDALKKAVERIKDLPSAQQQRTGRWIEYVEDGYVECPFCHSATTCNDNISDLHFCFSCGARMEGKE